MVYFTHIKPSLGCLGTATVKFTEYAIQIIEGIIVCQILIAIGTVVDNKIITLTGKIALALLFVSVVIRIMKSINFFHYEIVKKRIFGNSIDDFSYFILFIIAFASWPYSANVFGFLVEFSESIGMHIEYFVDGIELSRSLESDTSP